MVKIKSAGRLQTGLLVFSLAFLFIIVVCPMFALFSKAFHANDGTFIGFANFVEYFSSPHLVRSLKNSLVISTAVAAVATALAFVYAYALTRALVPAKKLLRFTAVLPLFAPTMMYGIALVYLIGNKGIITMAGLKLPLYGPLGIFISEVFYTFPQAFLILSITLAYCDNRLYEAARVMGSSAWRIFRTVTLPGAKFGIVSAFLVAFTLCFTDFGAPKVVGGNYSVLATDIYKQVVGQQNFGMGAVVGLLLMIPALVMFAADRFISSANEATVSSRSVSYRIIENKFRDRALTIFCVVINLFIFMLLGAGFFAAFIKAWPYNLSFTLEHFLVDSPATGGLSSFGNSIIVSLVSAVVGTAFVFVNAWLIEKTRGHALLRRADYLLSIIPLALPGLSIGIAFIFFFTADGNPFGFLYGTMWIMVLANMVHFYSVPFVTATSALKKLDREIEAVSESMSVPLWRTFCKVTLPMCSEALCETAVYIFVNSMVTISAVVFLYPADFKLASVAIVNMEDAGDIAPASALSVLVVLVNVAARLGYEFISARRKAKARAVAEA